MNKLDAAVNCLIKAASKVHPLIHAIKATQPKPTRKPRAKRFKLPAEEEPSAVVAETPLRKHRTRRFKLPASEEAVAEPTAAAETKGSTRKFTKVSQEAKDFMNMLRQKRKGKYIYNIKSLICR
jgi:hypothetical protein